MRQDRNQTITGKWNVKSLYIEGDFNGLINGLNFVDDVLHTGNWETAEVTGFKKIYELEAYNVATQFVNDIDVVNWIENAVRLNETNEQEIEGTVELGRSTFYNDIQVLGTVNGMIFSSENILTKTHEGQVINGNLTIRTLTPQAIRQLFIKNLFLRDGINGKNIRDIYENSLQSSDQRIDSELLIFEKPIITKTIETNHSIYGVDIKEFLHEHDVTNDLLKFQNNLRFLSQVGEDLKSSFRDVPVELSYFEDHQLLHGENIIGTTSFRIRSGSLVDYIIGVHEKKSLFEVIKFYRWNREKNLFLDDGTILPLEYSSEQYQVTKLNNVIQNGVDHLYVEIFDKVEKIFMQSLMLLDQVSRTFIANFQSQSRFSEQFFTLDSGSGPCYGSCQPSGENINIICDGETSKVLTTKSVLMVSSQNGIIILLTDDHQLQIWYQDKLRQVLKVLNPQSFTSIRFNGKFYLAVSCDRVERSIHHGSIEIFESGNDINFSLVQSFILENPSVVKFSVIPSGDLLLYILTRNPAKAFSVFIFAGASYFEEVVGSSTIINNGKDLSVISVDGKREFIAVVSNEIYVIEVIIKEY